MAEQAWRVAAAFGLVAAVAVPVGLACRRVGGPVRQWPAGGVGWNGADAGLLFAASIVARSAGVLAVLFVPAFVAGFRRWRAAVAAEPAVPNPAGRIAADVALAVRTWLWLTPLTFAVHLAAEAVLTASGGTPDRHSLTTADPLTMVVLACVVAPYFEELGFRRVLVPWAAGRRYRPTLVMLATIPGALFAALSAKDKTADLVGPFGLCAALAVGLWLLPKVRRVRRRFPVRTASAVWATAALFAVFHSSVWPTPVPLFVLGLGLGWLVARTRSVTAAAVTHALFNGVSAVYFLLGGT